MSPVRTTGSVVLMAATLAAVWLLWSGVYEPLFYALGGASVVAALVLALRMDLFRQDVFSLNLVWQLPWFWLWLTGEALKAALNVARICLSPSLPIRPTLIVVQPIDRGPVGVATLGNCITFTPGTVTVDVDADGNLLVHCLTRSDADGLLEGGMNRRVARVVS